MGSLEASTSHGRPVAAGRYDPARVANEVVVEAVWDGKLDSPTEDMLQAFEQAAAFALVAEERLHQQVQTGQCLANPEAWFAGYDRPTHLEWERDYAKRLCVGCPVRSQCLALDFTAARGRMSRIHGTWGGLGERDRKKLMPLWKPLVSRLLARPGAHHSWRTRAATEARKKKGER